MTLIWPTPTTLSRYYFPSYKSKLYLAFLTWSPCKSCIFGHDSFFDNLGIKMRSYKVVHYGAPPLNFYAQHSIYLAYFDHNFPKVIAMFKSMVILKLCVLGGQLFGSPLKLSQDATFFQTSKSSIRHFIMVSIQK